MNREPILAFVHIEKAAGTSLIHLLRHNYFPRYADVRPLTGEKVFTAKDLALYRRICPGLCAIGGHSVVPWSDLEKEADVQYITLLRDPIKRYVSQLRYWTSYLGKKISVEKYLAKPDPVNLQVKKIAGTENLELAIELIEQKFLCVGVVEQLDNFLLGLEKELQRSGFKALKISRNINTRNPVSADEIIFKHMDSIIENNKLDIALYDYVQKRIAQSIVGTDFAETDLPEKRISPALIGDFALRKVYIEPVTNWLRKRNGRNAKGSY